MPKTQTVPALAINEELIDLESEVRLALQEYTQSRFSFLGFFSTDYRPHHGNEITQILKDSRVTDVKLLMQRIYGLELERYPHDPLIATIDTTLKGTRLVDFHLQQNKIDRAIAALLNHLNIACEESPSLLALNADPIAYQAQLLHEVLHTLLSTNSTHSEKFKAITEAIQNTVIGIHRAIDEDDKAIASFQQQQQHSTYSNYGNFGPIVGLPFGPVSIPFFSSDLDNRYRAPGENLKRRISNGISKASKFLLDTEQSDLKKLIYSESAPTEPRIAKM